jgi:hypothetical protein
VAERGGLYCSFFRNSLVFCHFVCKTSIFCRLRTSLSSLFRLSNALQSLLWTSKVPKKSNMSNKPGFSFFAPTGYLQTPARGCSIFAVRRKAAKLDSGCVRAPLTGCPGSGFSLRRCDAGKCDRFPVRKLDNKREAAAHLFDCPSQCREVHIGALLDGAHLLLIDAER